MRTLVQLSSRTLLIALVGVPMLLYSLYLVVVAADRYVSESIVTVRQAGNDSAAAAIPGAAMLLAGVNPPAHQDTLFVKEFVHSLGLLLKLEQRLQLREHFASPAMDWPYRLGRDARQEEFLAYYRERVQVLFDDRSSLLTIRAQGFDPAFAQKLGQAILEESERFVNETSHRIARERLRFSESELELAGKRLQQARTELLEFQNRHQMLDPAAQAAATGMLASELEAVRSRLEAELGGLLAYLNEGSYQVKALRNRIAALDKQIEAERRRATSNGRKGERLTALALDFHALKLQTEFATDAYKLALGAVENARIEATRKLRNLVVVEPPSLPETAEYPLRTYNLSTLLAVCLLLFAMVRLVLATIREHQD
jgi:capsular polysaccharide transport system permease protein